MAVRKYTNRRYGVWAVFDKISKRVLYRGAYWECRRRMNVKRQLRSPNHFKIRVVKIGRAKNKIPYLPTLANVYKAYGGICQITGKKISRKDACIDHILPKSKGGEGWENVTLIHKNAVASSLPPFSLIQASIKAMPPMSGKSNILFQRPIFVPSSMRKVQNAPS